MRKDTKKLETVQSSITSMGFPRLQKSGEMCLWTDRSECLENSGTLIETVCVTMKKIHSLNVPCEGFMFYTSGLEVEKFKGPECGEV